MSLVPYVVEQTARGERSYDIFSRLLNDRIIVLSEDVNPNSASVIIAPRYPPPAFPPAYPAVPQHS